MANTMNFLKNPSAVLDYKWDWSSWLQEGEVITDHSILLPEGLTLESSSATADTVTAWLSGGAVGTNYRVVNRITTSAGRTDERSIKINVMER